MTTDKKAKSKSAKRHKNGSPSAAKYKPDTGTEPRKPPAEKSKRKRQPALNSETPSQSKDSAQNNPTRSDDKKWTLMLGVTITTNVLILSGALAFFILSITCTTVPTVQEPLGVNPGPSGGSSSNTGFGTGSHSSGASPAVGGSSSGLVGSPLGLPSTSGSSTSGSSTPPQDVILVENDAISNPNHQCGIPEIKPDLQKSRIVGGAEAVPHSWPFTVGIGVVNLLGGTSVNIMQMCGGTLISPRHALTAAHCFKSDPYISQRYSVFAGYHSRKTYKGVRPMLVVAVRMHPKTNAFTDNPWIVYDFALLTLSKEFTPDSKIQIACLPTLRKVLPEGTLCWATGWGKTQDTGAEDLLKQVVIDVVSEQTCQMRYNPDIVMKSTLCGGTTPGQDTCQGDSGGPLYHKENGKWVLYGVTSYGSEVCGSGPMAGYGAVSFNIEWICCFMSNMPGCAGIECNQTGEN